MKKIIGLLFVLFVFNINVRAQKYRGALGLHPINNIISWRTNMNQKRFWDYKLGFQVGSVSGLPFINLSPQVNVCWRKQNNESVKFYWGVGLGLETFVPRFSIPLGIEYFPSKNVPQFSVGVEASPELIFLGPGLTTTTIQGDFAFRYYFTKKEKKK